MAKELKVKKKKGFFRSKFFLWTAMIVIGSTADKKIHDKVRKQQKSNNR